MASPNVEAKTRHESYAFHAGPQTLAPYRGKQLSNSLRRHDNITLDTRIQPSRNESKQSNLNGTLRSTQRKNKIKKMPQRTTLGTSMKSSTMRSSVFDAQLPSASHIPIDLTQFLTDQDDTVPIKADVATETDQFLDLPPPEPYRPRKTGVDVSTQIEPDELWDFDVEVEPILQVIVGKTLEQALLECTEAAELETLSRRRIEMTSAREEEHQRILELERKAQSETLIKQQKMRQAQERLRRTEQMKCKMSSVVCGRRIAHAAIRSAMQHCDERGDFHSLFQSRFEANDGIAQSLYNGSIQLLNNRAVARAIVDDLIPHSVLAGTQKFIDRVNREREEREREAELKRQRELRRRYHIRITIHPPEWLIEKYRKERMAELDIQEDDEDAESIDMTGAPEDVTIGPISVARIDTVANIQSRVHEEVSKLQEHGHTTENEENGTDVEDEDDSIENKTNKYSWLANTRLRLVLFNEPLPEEATLQPYGSKSIMRGLGIRVYPADNIT